MSKVRILFLGTADFAVPALKAAFEDEHYEIVKVITQPDRPAGRKLEMKASPVKLCAAELGLEVLTPEKINQPEMLEEIASYKADIAVVIAYGQILSQKFLDLFPFGAVNVHGSLLPRWRGAAPVQRAIMAGDSVSGVCLQKVVKELDAGDVLGARRVEISEEMTASELYEILKERAAELIHIELMDYIRGNLSGAKQNPEEVTHAAKIGKQEGELDFCKTAEQIWNTYKALSIWPGVWTFLNGKKVKLTKVKKAYAKGEPGDIIENDKQSFYIVCGKGAIEVLELQPESKAKMKVKDFLNGFSLPKKVG